MPAPTCTNDIVSDYEVIEGGKAIKFSPCNIISHHPEDVRNYYCARCKRFMNDIIPIRKRTQAWASR